MVFLNFPYRMTNKGELFRLHFNSRFQKYPRSRTIVFPVDIPGVPEVVHHAEDQGYRRAADKFLCRGDYE